MSMNPTPSKFPHFEPLNRPASLSANDPLVRLVASATSRMRFNKQQKQAQHRKRQGKKPLIVWVAPGQLVPDNLMTTMCYNHAYTLNNAGFTETNGRLSPLNAYDIDPLFGSTSMPGFSELNTLYSSYRVAAFKIRLSIANQETFSGILWVCPSQADPGSNTTSVNLYLANPLAHIKPVGPLTGNNIHEFNCSYTTEELGGNADYTAADAFRGYGSTPPSQLFYIAYGMHGSTTLVSGILINVNLEVMICFGKQAQPSS